MSFKKEIIISNYGVNMTINIFDCDRCHCEIQESDIYTTVNDKRHYCLDCSFVERLISEVEYINGSGIYINNAHAAVKNGKPIIWIGKAPWNKTTQDIRSSKEYSEWRTSVFERDGYTCQHCFQVGGTLNAHHIKPFAKYPLLRFDLNNGITLCYECHKEVHKKR